MAELSNRIAVKAEWTAADRLAALKRISEAAEAEDPRVAVSAISEANKMQGSHAPAKMDHLSSDGSMTPKPALDVSKLSTAALAEIMAAADEADKDGPAGN